jgi:integrase/recombinase XerD
MTSIGDTRITTRAAPGDGAEPGGSASRRLARLAGAWLESVGAPNTRRAYRRDLEEWTAWLGECDVGLLEASREHVDGWVGSLERDGRAPATRSRKLSGIGSFYTYAMEEGHRFGLAVTGEPTARYRRPHLDRYGSARLTVGQARGVLRAADADGPRAGAIVRLILEVGLGVRDVTGARVQDLGLDGAHRVLTVSREGGRRRRVVLPADVAYVVDRAAGGRDEGPVIITRAGRRVADSQVFRTVRLAGDRAGVELTPQRLRDAGAALALDAGARLRDVQGLLGHTGRRAARGGERSRADLAEAPSYKVAALLGCPAPR